MEGQVHHIFFDMECMLFNFGYGQSALILERLWKKKEMCPGILAVKIPGTGKSDVWSAEM